VKGAIMPTDLQANDLDDVIAFDGAWQRYLGDQRRGRLATVGSDGAPQNKPVGYVYNTDLGTIDIVGFDMDTSAKYRNIGVNPDVAFVVDDAVSDGAAGMRFLEVRGVAERVSVEPPMTAGVSSQIIRIHPRRVISLNIDPNHSGFRTRDLAPTLDEAAAMRPSLDVEAAARSANDAVAALVEELQAGWDQQDADVTDASLADDVVWGSPFGATLQGYAPLHDIHVRLKRQAAGGTSSRFEIVNLLAPGPNVAVATAAPSSRHRISRVHFRRWLFTCWFVAAGHGGLPPGRTRPFVPRPAKSERPAEAKRLTSKALSAAAEGRLEPIIGQTFSLQCAADAHRAIEARESVGKTLLTP
jgi:pyridoxamine 5'-phosphate oxidase family protein